MKKENIEKIVFLSTILIIGLAIVSSDVFATEIAWPDSPMGTALAEYRSTTITALVRYFYEWGISIGALFAFVSIVVAGFQYLTSTGSPFKIAKAMERIKASFLGLALLLGTFLILNTINPDLTFLDISSENVSTSMGEFDFVEYEFTSTCAYAKIYENASDQKQDKTNNYNPEDQTNGITVKVGDKPYNKLANNDSTLYNSVKFFSIPTLNQQVTHYVNGEISSIEDPEEIPFDQYPEAYKSKLYNVGEEYYIDAVGTDCKMYFFYELDCNGNEWLAKNLSFSTNSLGNDADLDISIVNCFKVIENE
ncbi:MAG: pilin [Candidatus Methanomethylophilus sp.]|nr:pilin [Methanomethylophilus sp.]